MIFFPQHPDTSLPPGRTRRLVWRLGKLIAFAASVLAMQFAPAQQLASPIGAAVPHHYLVAYREGAFPSVAESFVRIPGVQVLSRHQAFGIAVLQINPGAEEAATIAALRAQPSVEYVIHDRILSAHSLILRPVLPATFGITIPPPSAPTPPPAPADPYDTYYTASPQNWAVVQSGGYGNGISGGPEHGPWDTTFGNGIRIAILDSGVDAAHPDIVPTSHSICPKSTSPLPPAFPAPAMTAPRRTSRATARGQHRSRPLPRARAPDRSSASRPPPPCSTSKSSERMPDPAITASDIATAVQHRTGQRPPFSWVIQGIEDAIANHADVISLSLGHTVDLTTGEGAGLKAAFDRVTYAATQAGIVLDRFRRQRRSDLANPRYIELPAQARDVLAIVASTNPACGENLAAGATCAPGPVTLPYYSELRRTARRPRRTRRQLSRRHRSQPGHGVSGWIRGACSYRQARYR